MTAGAAVSGAEIRACDRTALAVTNQRETVVMWERATGRLRYSLEGSLPAKGELCSVFTDPFGRPLSPVSAAGMHRRDRRSDRR